MVVGQSTITCFLSCVALNAARNATSVSYTHLDVYKRQAYLFETDATIFLSKQSTDE